MKTGTSQLRKRQDNHVGFAKSSPRVSPTKFDRFQAIPSKKNKKVTKRTHLAFSDLPMKPAHNRDPSRTTVALVRTLSNPFGPKTNWGEVRLCISAFRVPPSAFIQPFVIRHFPRSQPIPICAGGVYRPPTRNPKPKTLRLKPPLQCSTLIPVRAHGMWTYEPRQGRKAATVVCSTSAVVTLAFFIFDLWLGMAKSASCHRPRSAGLRPGQYGESMRNAPDRRSALRSASYRGGSVKMRPMASPKFWLARQS